LTWHFLPIYLLALKTSLCGLGAKRKGGKLREYQPYGERDPKRIDRTYIRALATKTATVLKAADIGE
jgi:hypothetical protein